LDSPAITDQVYKKKKLKIYLSCITHVSISDLYNVEVCLESSRRNLLELSLIFYKDPQWFPSLRRKSLIDVGGTFRNLLRRKSLLDVGGTFWNLLGTQ
jgi:hypothetical protein